MKSRLFDDSIVRSSNEVLEFISNILESSTEYSIIGQALDRTIVLWNEGARRMYGYEPGEDDIAAGVPTTIQQTAMHGGKWAGQLERVRKKGKLFTASVVVTLRYNGTGQPIGFLLISKDISEEIRLTEEVRATQFYTRSLIESNVDALMTTDPLGVITAVNQQMAALTGCSHEELIGSPFKTYFTDPERAENGIKLVLGESKVTNYELTVRGRDGRDTVVSYNAATFYDRNGELQGVFAAARDVTERKRAEERFRRLLESAPDPMVIVNKDGEIVLVNSQTERLFGYKREELLGQRVEILMPEQSRGRHSSHRNTYYSNPRVRPMGEGLELPGPLNHEQDDQLTAIETSANHMLSLINDLLDLAKIESGKVELSRTPVLCQDVLHDISTTMRPMAEAKGLHFAVQAPQRDLLLQTDRRALSQILLNLANNALKFIERGEVRLIVERRRIDGRRLVEITISDTDIGIHPEDRARLFQAFEQLHTGVVRRHEGTGLGLHLSQKLANLLGARSPARASMA